MKLDGYIRVSQVRGRSGDSFISPKQQAERIQAWADMHGHTLVAMHEELDQSGAKADRPKLLEALRRIEAGETDGLVVAKLDRFGRSLVHSLAAIERIHAAGGLFASVADGFDLGTETGRLLLRTMLSLAEFELDRVRSNFADARARAVARGIHPCPVPPVGYRRRQDGGLEPGDAAGAIAEAFRRRANGVGLADIARGLETVGVAGAYGHTSWTPRAVKQMLRNRVYLGEARHGEFVNKEAHGALIDGPTWDRAQRPSVSVGPEHGRKRQLLAGLMRCAGCRYGMASCETRGARQYRCHRKHPAGRCPAPASISTATGLEAYVVAEFFDAVGAMVATPSIESKEFAQMERDVSDAANALTTFRDDPRVFTSLGMDFYVDGLESRKRDFDEAVARLESARTASGIPRELASVKLEEVWLDLTVDEQRRLLSHAIEAIFVRRGRTRHEPIGPYVHICWRGEGPELPRRGSRGQVLLAPFTFPADAPTQAGMALA